MAAVLMVSAVAASAQVSFWSKGAPDHRITIGPRIGLNLSNMSFNDDAKMESPYLEDNLVLGETKVRPGFRVGAAVDIAFNNNMSIATGLYFTSKGFKYESMDKTGTEKLCANYLELPIYATYKINFDKAGSLSVGFGPYFAVGLGGKHKVEEIIGDEDNYLWKFEHNTFGTDLNYQIDTDDEDMDELIPDYGMKRFDAGLGFTLGYEFKHFTFTFEGQFGLANVLNTSKQTASFNGDIYNYCVWGSERYHGLGGSFDSKAKTVNCALTIGYNFPL